MGTKTLRFTKKALIDLPAAKNRRDSYRDTQQRFLYLRVSTTGRKTFYYVRKVKGRVRFIQLDTFPEMSVQEARKQCAGLSGEYAAGKDPAKRNGELLETATFLQVFDRYMEEHCKPHCRTWKEDQRRFDVYFPHLGARKARDIDTNELARLHARIGEERGRVTANRCLQLIRRVFG